MTLPAPFPPLVSGDVGLDTYPGTPAKLAARMAEIYGAPVDSILPVRGATHGLELVWRLAGREGAAVQAPDEAPYRALAAIYPAPTDARAGAVVIRGGGDPAAAAAQASAVAPALLVVDEGAVEFSGAVSAATIIPERPNLVVLRSLSLAWGLAGARVGAVLAQPGTLARLAAMLEPHALPAPSIRLALQALDPSRMAETTARIATVRAERARLAKALALAASAEEEPGPAIRLRPADAGAATAALARYGVAAERDGDALRLPVSAKAEVNDRLLLALGAAAAAPGARRTAEVVRDTRETRIVCAVDLDSPGPVRIGTGVGFFDHMLEQVAAHGGFSLRLACEGDLHIDPHHTVEDCAIALGQALKQALGERRGIARYGFVLPMDEAEAKVSIDLSGRPYPVFVGRFDTAFLGDYRTDLTAHVFRSLAEHLGAAIHVSVTGEDDHHKTEAVYKAFGRALRQAIRVEGEAVPSTKGVL